MLAIQISLFRWVDMQVASFINNSRRSLGIDISKGILVLFMLVHHTWGGINASLVSIDLQGVLIFIMGSFVLLAGVVVGLFLVDKYYASPINRTKRDLFRSSRLYGIYFVPNVLLYLVNYRGVGDHSTFYDWVWNVALLKAGDAAVFEILGVIGLFLITTTLILSVLAFALNDKSSLNIFRAVVALVTVAFGLLVLSGFESIHPLLSFGFIGVGIGVFISFKDRMNSTCVLFNDESIPRVLAILFIACVSILMFTSVKENYFFYTLIVTLMIYLLSLFIVKLRLNFLATLGKYSLLCYMFQVVLCRIINLSGFINITAASFVSTFLLVILIVGGGMFFLVYWLEVSRRKSVAVDKVYRLMFG